MPPATPGLLAGQYYPTRQYPLKTSVMNGKRKSRIIKTGICFFICAITIYIVVMVPGRNTESSIQTTAPPPPRIDIDQQLNTLLYEMQLDSAPPEREDFVYVVQPGNSLNRIARMVKREYLLEETPQEIMQGIIVRNNLDNPKLIKAGLEVTIPLSQFIKQPEVPPTDPTLEEVYRHCRILDACAVDTLAAMEKELILNKEENVVMYQVRRGDSLYNIAQSVKERHGLTIPLKSFVQEIAARNDIDDPQAVHPETLLEIKLANHRTLTGLLNYDGYKKRAPAIKYCFTEQDLKNYVARALKRYGNIPAKTFKRMLRVESGGDFRAISPVGAAGLMQIMPLTGKRLGLRIWNEKGYSFPEDIGAPGAKSFYERYARELRAFVRKNPRKIIELDDRFNPEKNIFASARLFSRLVASHGTANAVAMYNGGVRGISKNRAQETRNYMKLVLR